ncbi:MAG: hypothetical protein H6735_33885 [Alphaproteobacteria bacterium]|nr:hypothetical protein [Alphaproteobacteria bacterium]
MRRLVVLVLLSSLACGGVGMRVDEGTLAKAAGLLTLVDEGPNREAARRHLDEAWLGLENADTLAASGLKLEVEKAVADGVLSDEEVAGIEAELQHFRRPDGLTEEDVAGRLAAFEERIAEEAKRHPPRRAAARPKKVRATGKLGSLSSFALTETMGAAGWTERRCRQRMDDGELDLRCSWEREGALVALEAWDHSDAEAAGEEADDQLAHGAAVAVDGARLLIVAFHDTQAEAALADRLCPDDCSLRQGGLLRDLPTTLRAAGATTGDCSSWTEDGDASHECELKLDGRVGWVEIGHRDRPHEASERRTMRSGGLVLDQGDAELNVSLLSPGDAQIVLTKLLSP